MTENETPTTPLLIAIDHGYGNIKTPNFIFPSGVTACDAEPAMAVDQLLWAGHWYAIGDVHKEFLADKTSDEDYLKLTMAAIAKELNKRNRTAASVWLAVGLPLTWYGEQKESFARYLQKVKHLEYQFNGTDYSVDIEGVDVFAQGFAAVADRLKEFSGVNMLCDIGNGTMNIMYINNGRPVSSRCFTEKYGVHQCVLAAREEVMRVHHVKVDDSIIEAVLRTGSTDAVHPKLLETIQNAARRYVDGIMRSLREHEYNPMIVKLWFMGGGACLIRHFAEPDKSVHILEDVQANAKGYQRLEEKALQKRGLPYEK